jgi:predicted ATPase
MNKLIVVSGCSGGGKSTLISALSQEGYTIIPEVGREIVKEQLANENNILPWQHPKLFCELLIDRSITAFNQASQFTHVKDNIIFFDRSFLEGVSYYQSFHEKDAPQYDHYIDEFRFYSTIFMTPPWEEIYIQDEERKHSFEEAVSEYERLLRFYPQHGYNIIELPKVSVKNRVQFIRGSIPFDIKQL